MPNLDRVSARMRLVRHLAALVAGAAGFVFCAVAAAKDDSADTDGASQLTLHTNQQLIEEIKKPSAFDIEDVATVFRLVFFSLPDAVQVYPTENYYYFRFYRNGIEYGGNLRLAAVDRDTGILHFAYFAAANNSSSDGKMHYKPLSEEDGVRVEKLDRLEYKVEYQGKKVIFRLNDLSDVKPPAALLRDSEVYIGPVFDESGIQFFLVFNSDRNVFHYILNENEQLLDELLQSSASERILIGRRTGFAYYMDHYFDRKLLIGVHTSNVWINNYFDGPFDQLPDNFITSDKLMKAIEASDPYASGRIDKFGYLKGSEGRYLIGPYLSYSDPSTLAVVDRCASDPTISREVYPSCFSIQGRGQ